jgi:hypothetical protein
MINIAVIAGQFIRQMNVAHEKNNADKSAFASVRYGSAAGPSALINATRISG